MTAEQFLISFPEFASAPDGMIQAYLDQQAEFVSDTWAADRVDLVHGLRTADALARSPFGRNARLVTEDKKTGKTFTTYAGQLNELKIPHGCCLNRLA